MAAHWIDLQKSPPPIDLYEKEVAEQWREIGCAVDGAPHVITRLVNIMSTISASSLGPIPLIAEDWVKFEHSRIFISPFSPDSAEVLRLAADFLKEDCAGARGITERTRMQLKALHDRVPQQKR
jgi:hypothetical protein